MLRGGAYKPRTSPYSFQGLGVEGLRLLQEAKEETGLPIVTELMDVRDVDDVVEVADVIQIGARNMQNYTLLTEVGRSGMPVLLKRGLSSTLDDLLMAAEYVLKEGNPNVILCERGIRTFETAYRFTLDLLAIPALRELTHLPVVVDPSHAPGRRDWVPAMSMAAAAAGADGIIVEVHNDPEHAICDGPQALPSNGFADYADQVRRVAEVAGKLRQRLKLAVLGVGLIGGSIGLAAKRRLDAEVAGFDPDPANLERAARAGALDSRRRLGRRGGRRRRRRLLRGAGRRPAGTGRRGARGRAARDRGHRRRLDEARADRRPSGAGTLVAVHRRPPARRRRDGGSRERPRGPVRGRPLVPDPDRALERAALRPPAARDRRPRRPAAGDRRRDPRPADGDRQPPPARARQRARRRGRGGAAGGVRAPARGRPELPRHDPGRRREPGDLGRHLRHQPRGGRRRDRRRRRAAARQRPS